MDHVELKHPHDLRGTEIVTKFGVVHFRLRRVACLDCDLLLCWPTFPDVSVVYVPVVILFVIWAYLKC
jgi:hypothetical protein